MDGDLGRARGGVKFVGETIAACAGTSLIFFLLAFVVLPYVPAAAANTCSYACWIFILSLLYQIIVVAAIWLFLQWDDTARRAAEDASGDCSDRFLA
jgi:hypothetical protein